MKLTQLDYVVAVADHGTVTAAAKAMFVAQPAVSRAIAALEAELNIDIFERRGGRLVLTPVGERVVGEARGVLAGVAAIGALGRAADGEPSARFSIAATPTLEEIATARLLPLARAAVGDVPLKIHTVEDPVAVADLVRDGVVDVGLTDLRPGDGLDAVPLFDEEIVLASPPGSPRRPLPLEELGSVPLVLPPTGTRRRAEFDAFFTALGVTPEVAVETNDRLAWNAHVRAGLGSAFRYRSQVERLSADGIVCRPLVPALVRHVCVLFAADRSSPVREALVDALAPD